MNRRLFHFQPTLDVDRLRAAIAAFFEVTPDRVFLYSDAVDILGSAERAPDPVQVAAYEAGAVCVLLRRYAPESGPLEGWLAVERHPGPEVEDFALACVLAGATDVKFYFLDPVPDPDDEPDAGAAKVEIAPDGARRQVWVSEFSDESGTQTIVSGRGADEDDAD